MAAINFHCSKSWLRIAGENDVIFSKKPQVEIKLTISTAVRIKNKKTLAHISAILYIVIRQGSLEVNPSVLFGYFSSFLVEISLYGPFPWKRS